jgi:hypothetical protein
MAFFARDPIEILVEWRRRHRNGGGASLSASTSCSNIGQDLDRDPVDCVRCEIFLGLERPGYLARMETMLVMLLAAGAVAFVLYPIVRGGGAAAPSAGRWAGEPLDQAALAAEIDRYRAAIRAGSACRRCSTANPPGSRFCAECGRRLVSRT